VMQHCALWLRPLPIDDLAGTFECVGVLDGGVGIWTGQLKWNFGVVF